MFFKRLTLPTSFTRVLGAGTLALVLGCSIALAADEKTPTTKPATPAATTKPAPLSPEAKKAADIARVLEFMRNYQPDAYDKALRLRETEPAKFEQLVLPVVYTVNSLDDLKKNNPELYHLKIEDYKLTFQIEQKRKELRRPDLAAAEHDKLVAQVTQMVTRKFEVEQELRRADIKAIQERINKLQAALDDREKHKDALIKARLKEVIPGFKDVTQPAAAPAK